MASLRELLGQVDVSMNQSASTQELTVEALETLIGMVKANALTESEITELQSSIEVVFNNVLNENHHDEDYEDDYSEEGSDEYYDDAEYSEEGEEAVPEFMCTNGEEDEDGELVCGWAGSEEELSYSEEDAEAAGVCPSCGSAVEQVVADEEYSEDDVWNDDEYSEDELEEAMLNKTAPVDRKASKMYKKSAAGKKSMKLNARKRAKYATKISRCSEKGKTFSFKTMSCAKPMTRR